MKNNYVGELFKIIKYNFNTFFQFEIFYKLLLSIVLIPVLTYSLKLTMSLTGYEYLTLDNIKLFLINPITIILLLIIIIFLTIITLFDINTLIIIFDFSHNNKKITLKEALKLSFIKGKSIFKIKNLSVAFLILFLISFINIGITSNVITSIKIPEFIMDYINSNIILIIIYIIVYLFLVYILVKWLFSIHYMVLDNLSFKEARNKSKNLIKGYELIDLLKIIFVQILLFIMFSIILILGFILTLGAIRILHNIKVIESIFMSIIWVFIITIFIIYDFISTGISYALISVFYYNHKLVKKEKVLELSIVKNNKVKKKSKIKYLLYLIFIVIFIICTIFTYKIVNGEVPIEIEYSSNTKITAHRGASAEYPENTMASFKGAVDLGADIIELDVQQTKDGYIVVSHDSSLKRTAGIKKRIYNMTYDEIKNIDVGSKFDSKFKGETIPTLSDVIKFAKNNNIELNIEIKPTGNEVDIEKSVIDLIKKYDYQDKCVIASLSYDILKNVKEIDSNIKTVYVMALAIGDLNKFKYADVYSVEASNVNENFVKTIHDMQKEIYVWTVNTEDAIINMYDLNVDNIITDDIKLAINIIKENNRSDLIKELLNLLAY